MPRWTIYIRGGKGFATRTHILLDDDTRPRVFTSLKAAQVEAAKHEHARVEREPDAERPRRAARAPAAEPPQASELLQPPELPVERGEGGAE